MAEGAAAARLRVALDLSLPRLLRAAGYRVDTSPSSRRRVELHDTTDRRLAAAGAELSLNVRDGWLWRRDTAGHPKLSPRTWEAPTTVHVEQLMAWTRAYRRGRLAGPRIRTTVHHRSHRIRDQHGEALLSIDEERHDVAVGGRWVPRVRRLVVGAAADEAPVAALVALITPHTLPDGATLALLRPALVRAPCLHVAEATETGPRELLARSLTLSVVQWIFYDCEVSSGGTADAVRKLRVALRRLRSDMQTFGPLLDRDWSDALRDRLGVLAAQVGVVRDAEVMVARLAELAGCLPEAGQPEALPLLDTAGEQLAAARSELLATLAGDAYAAVLDDAIGAAASPRWRDEAPHAPLTELARRPWRRLSRFVQDIGTVPDDEQLHRVRILAKRARYATEACVPSSGAAATAAARRLADLQGVLGELHDAVVTRDWLRRQAEASATVAFAAGELAALELGRLEHARTRWHGAWVAASRKQDWRWLRG